MSMSALSLIESRKYRYIKTNNNTNHTNKKNNNNNNKETINEK